MTNVNQTASDNAEEFGFHAGDLVQEWLWDDDVDDSIRAKIEELTGEELVDEDYDSAVDGVIIWWRDGDDEDELSDTIVDAYAVLGDDGPLWVLTPKPGRPGAASSSTVQSAAKTAGMNAATPLTVSGDWNGICAPASTIEAQTSARIRQRPLIVFVLPASTRMAKVGRSYKGLESHDSKPFCLRKQSKKMFPWNCLY